MTRKGPIWLLVMAIGSLVFVGITASDTHYLQEPYNPGFLEFPVVTAMHVVLGGLYLTLAPFQWKGSFPRPEAGRGKTGFVICIEDLHQGTKTQAKEGVVTQMIKDVPLTGIFVNDQEAALEFYTNTLGLEKVQDEAYGPDARWITVSPAESKTRIVLKKAEREHEKAMVGNSDGAPILTLGTVDIHAAYERLEERGVRFLGEPYRYPWGIGVLLLDQDGSPILLQQELDRK